MAHFNCRGIANEERMWKLETALDKIKWDTISISEVRKMREGLMLRKSGNYFYFIGETKGIREWPFYLKRNFGNE